MWSSYSYITQKNKLIELPNTTLTNYDTSEWTQSGATEENSLAHPTLQNW